MRRVSKLGAALAVALSVAFATPSAAHAAAIPTVRVGLEKKKINDTYSDSLITEDNNVVFKTTDEKAWDAEWKKYSNDRSYQRTSKTIGSVTTYYIYQTTYKNEITGASSLVRDDVAPEEKNAEESTFTSTVYVDEGVPTDLAVSLRSGDTHIKKIKSSKKSVLSAELNKKKSTVTKTDKNVSYYTDKDGNKYYYKTTGEKVYLPKDNTKDSPEYKATNGSSATAYIRINPKKTGTSKVSFKIYNKDGKETGKASIKVIVRSDSDILKTFTFAGKNLLPKKWGEANYINNGRKINESNYNYTDKKKGKLVVKANKGYKIVKIQVGTFEKPTAVNGYSYDKYTNTYYNTDNEYYSDSRSGKGVTKHYDYNGDGDYLDTVNGNSEYYAGLKFKTVKSGKTIKLGKYASESHNWTTTSVDKNKDGNKTTVTNSKYYNDYATTLIVVTYYNKETRNYGRIEMPLYTKNQAK
ncbi:hypothetical protein [Butyrivibrio sp. JL13D10]|uniref:hypothetical protein n=1 Tax=Butyrivibrio sp. JL13D10 TaxID=3236815 RepID=UPI0038B67725